MSTTSDWTVEEMSALLTTVRRDNEADLASARATLAEAASDGTAASGSLVGALAAAENMVEDAETILAEVDAAEQRLADGSYGRCASCGGDIGGDRLRVRPWVRECVTCAGARRH